MLNPKTRVRVCVSVERIAVIRMRRRRTKTKDAQIDTVRKQVTIMLDYIDSSDASRYKGTREICEAIMDPIAVTALLYKLNIVKLQCISSVARVFLLYRVKSFFSS